MLCRLCIACCFREAVIAVITALEYMTYFLSTRIHMRTSKRPCVLVFALGTFCDNSLMLNFVRVFKQDHKVLFMTDDHNKSKVPKGVDVSTFEMPRHIMDAVNIPLADTSISRLKLLVKYWKDLVTMNRFIAAAFSQLQTNINRYRPAAILLPYTALFFLFLFPTPYLKTIPIIIIHYAPAYPNNKIPWLFDKSLTYDSFHLYRDPGGSSSLENTSRQSFPAGLFVNNKTMWEKLRSSHHIACWPLKSTQKIKPLLGLEIHQAGALYDETLMKARGWHGNGKPTAGLKAAMQSRTPKVFVSMGTYARTLEGFKNLSRLLTYLMKNTPFTVILHHSESFGDVSFSDDTKRLHIHKGWIPYEWIVPRVQCVVFTGSVCLLTTALYNKVPVIMTPIIPEQYFWAKNYKHFTHIPYVVDDIDKFGKALESSIPPSHLARQYLERCSKDIKANKGHQLVHAYVSGLIATGQGSQKLQR